MGRAAQVTNKGQRPRAGWRQRKAFVDAWIRAHGHVRPGIDGIPHQATDLTADHIHPVALGGSDRDGLRVLCRSCNASLGASLGNALNDPPRRHSRVW